MIVMGFMANRLNVSIPGLQASAGVYYVPKWTEFAATLSCADGGGDGVPLGGDLSGHSSKEFGAGATGREGSVPREGERLGSSELLSLNAAVCFGSVPRGTPCGNTVEIMEYFGASRIGKTLATDFHLRGAFWRRRLLWLRELA
jgi:hypothetical protein